MKSVGRTKFIHYMYHVMGADDSVTFGPADVVWPALAEYRQMKEEEAGAVFNDAKARCFSPNGEYGERPERFKVGVAVDEEGQVVGEGLVVWGCFCGQEGFVSERLKGKGEQIRSLIEKTVTRLGSVDPDSLMAITRACSAHMGDWYVQMHDPTLTGNFARGVDGAVAKAVTATPLECANDPSCAAERSDLLAAGAYAPGVDVVDDVDDDPDAAVRRAICPRNPTADVCRSMKDRKKVNDSRCRIPVGLGCAMWK